VQTLKHRRFTEFCDACSRCCYSGLRYGAPGVGKTLSAGRYSRWDVDKQIDPWRKVRGVSMEALTGLNTIFYTPPIINTPRQIEDDIERLPDRLKRLAFEPHPTPKCKPTYAEVAEVYRTKEKALANPQS
jgi:hypothetical protein